MTCFRSKHVNQTSAEDVTKPTTSLRGCLQVCVCVCVRARARLGVGVCVCLRYVCLFAGLRFSSKFSGCSARERDFERQNDEILRMLRMGTSIFFKLFRMLRTGTRFSSESSGCSARERDFL